LVRDLVNQFDRPLDFYRELIQNSIDAGSNLIDVDLHHDGEKAVIRVVDDGEGMDERIIDDFLLVLFRSTKEEDFTKIGKFGIGFVSVFAIKPELVRVRTGKAGESWRVDFPSYRRYEKYRLSTPVEGTVVELVRKMNAKEFEKFAAESRETIRYWCKHSEARILFRVGGSGSSHAGPDAGPGSALAGTRERLSEPFGLRGSSLRHEEEGTEIEFGFSADQEPFFGFYNRGLTLKEGNKAFFPGVCFKAKSRYLEHTLTRDNVMVDENYEKLMRIIGGVVEGELPGKLRADLRALASDLSRRGAKGSPDGALDADLKLWSEEWSRRIRFLRAQFSGTWSRWRRSDWRIFPSLSGQAVSLDAVKKDAAKGRRLLYDSGPGRVVGTLLSKKRVVLLSGPWVELLASWLKIPALRAGKAYIQPQVFEERKLDKSMRAFLSTLRQLDSRSGARYGGIVAADLAYPGSAVKERLFVIQKTPGALSPAWEPHLSSVLWFRKTKRWALINGAHPSMKKLLRLHGSRPGMAAFLALKMMHLNDGEVPPESESEYTNLAEKVEARLLAGALKLDARSR